MRMNADGRSWRRQSVKLPAKSVTPVSFIDTSPNSVYIRNNGDSVIYCGFHTTPTAKNCDLDIKPGSVKTYGEQLPFGRVLIYNESANTAEAIVVSWEASLFDPALLQTDIDMSADLINAMRYDGIIQGFNSALPEGQNHIGTVSMEGLESLIAAAEQYTRPVETDFWTGYLEQYASAQMNLTEGEVLFVANDGPGQMAFSIGGSNTILLEAGEAIHNMPIHSTVRITANSGAVKYRAALKRYTD